MSDLKTILHLVRPIILCISFSCIYNLMVYSQNYIIRSFTTFDGLPHNDVQVITHDKTGYIWIGTWDGLSRYDGYEFKNYYHIPGDTTSLAYFSIMNLCVDKANNLWILHSTGQLSLYQRSTETFYQVNDLADSLWSYYINIGLDEEENLLVICRDKIYKRYHNNGRWRQYALKDNFGNPLILPLMYLDIGLADDSEVWMVGKKVFHFSLIDSNSFENSRAQLLRQYELNSKQSILPANLVFTYHYDLYNSLSGNSWIFSNTGLFKLDKSLGEFNVYSGDIPKNEFKGIKMFIWGCEKVGFSYDPENELFIKLPVETQQFSEAYFCQNNNSYWYARNNKNGIPLGIQQVIRIPGFFKKIKVDREDENISIYTVYKDKKNILWVGTEKPFISKLTPEGGIYKFHDLPSEILKKGGFPKVFIEDSTGFWIGFNFARPLIHIDTKTGELEQHFPDALKCQNILIDRQGKLYLGSDSLLLYDAVTKKTEILWVLPKSYMCYKIVSDSKQKIWMALNFSNLLYYDPVLKIAQQYRICEEPYNIEDICFGDNGDIWLALLGGGICRFNPETGRSVFYTTFNGLSNNTTYCLVKDRYSNIWVSTDHGISMLNSETGKIRTFGRNDGLDIIEFNSDATYQSPEGEVFFGGTGGLVRFHPDSIINYFEKREEVPLVINELYVSGEIRYLEKPLNETDTIRLHRGENNFHMTFAALEFTNPEKINYRYRMDGVNAGWVNTSAKNRNINYSNLKPGIYRLAIEATNQSGEWSSSREVMIRISQSFYKTLWFRLMVLFVILILFFAIIWLYIRQIKIRERQKQDELRLESLRSQMNPHFIFNSLNSINYFISRNDRLSANKYISDFARLIRFILSNTKSDYIPFEKEIASLHDYLEIEYLRFGDKFDYVLEGQQDIDPSLEIFPGIVQPFIENAIWHGVRGLENRKGLIRIWFKQETDEKLKCIIEDDGIGRKGSSALNRSESNRQSKGIQIVRDRLKIISKARNKDYLIDISDLYPDRTESGTRVIIDIPCKKQK